MNKFDHIFYLNLYPDLVKAGINTKIKAFNHYINNGKKEGRVCSQIEIDKIQERSKKIILKNTKNMSYNKHLEEKINILIRTSDRSDDFRKCIESVLNQNYQNYQIIICYDTTSSLKYLNSYKNNPKVMYFFLETESNMKYKFNLYNNLLMDKVNDGWIIFLDDDCKMIHANVLKIINENLNSHNTLYLWKFLRADKIIYPKKLSKIKLGDIGTCSVCFNSKYKYLSRWNDKQYGDFNFYHNLIKNGTFNMLLINHILIETISKKIIGRFGN